LIAGDIDPDLLAFGPGPAALRAKLRSQIQLLAAVWTELRHKQKPAS
jgi:hypothetical protein